MCQCHAVHVQFTKSPRTSDVIGCFGVFDGRHDSSAGLHQALTTAVTNAGHGGPNAADFVRTNLFNNLMSNVSLRSNTIKAIGK